MAPTTWTTPEQSEFLRSWLLRYQELALTKNYDGFWTQLHATWSEKWSERDILFPNVQTPLNSAQNDELGAAVKARRKQLKTWFRWRTNGSHRGCMQQKRSSVFDKALEPKGSRILSQQEIYTIEYYEDRIKPRIEVAKESGSLNSRGEVLRASRQLSKELLETEDKAVKERVEELYKLQKKKSQSDEDQPSEPTDAVEIQRAIDDLPYALARIAELIKSHTRFAVSFICAGPDPSQNWEITSMSCHPDEAADGNTFAKLYPKEENAMLSAFRSYAEALFPPELRDPTRATNDTDVVEASTEGEAPTADQSHGGEDVSGDVQDGAFGDGEVKDNGSKNDVDCEGTENDEDDEGADDDDDDEGTDDDEDNENIECANDDGKTEGESREKEVGGDVPKPSTDAVASFYSTNMSGGMDPVGSTSLSVMGTSLGCDASSQTSTIESQNLSFENHSYNFDLGLPGGMVLPPPTLASMIGPSQPSMQFAAPTQSMIPLGSIGNYVNPNFMFNQSGPIAPHSIPFCDTMSNVATDLAGWNFSGIALDSFTPSLSPAQFDTCSSNDPLLPPLPPMPQDNSPVRPRLPAVPPPSPLDNDPGVTSAEAVTTNKTCPKPKTRCNVPKPPAGSKGGAKTQKLPKLAASNVAAGSNMEGAATTTPSNPTTTLEPRDLPVAVGQQTSTPVSAELVTDVLPVIQHPSNQQNPVSPPTPRSSKRVSVQSKRNAISNAIGTNRQTFVGGANDIQQVSSPKQKGKRTGDTTEGKTKK